MIPKPFWKVSPDSNGVRFYNPNKSGDRTNPRFDDEGKRYYRKCDAVKAAEFLKAPMNTHWCPAVKKTVYEAYIFSYMEHVISVDKQKL